MKKPETNNLTAFIQGHNLNVFQKADAVIEFNKLLEYIEYIESEVKKCDLADVGERNAAKIWGIMADPSINKKTYDRLAEVYNDICDPVNKGNLPIRIDVNYV